MSTSEALDLTTCDLEPIHIPGSIQTDGTLLIVDPTTSTLVGFAGQVDEALLGRPISEICDVSWEDLLAATPASGVNVSRPIHFRDQDYDVISYRSGDHVCIELLHKAAGVGVDASYLADFINFDARLERAGTLEELADEAARAFHHLTGFDRVMVYRFVEEGAGQVLGEYRSGNLSSFLNHHFPATDIPKQARALYVRNKVRVISDVHYQPQPIVSASSSLTSIDLSDSALRSVSPVHIQYLKNMGVGASASMSIIRDGQLWGLIACHHPSPKSIPLSIRLATQSLATDLAHMLKAREEGEVYYQRSRLRTQEDHIFSRLTGNDQLADFLGSTSEELAKLMAADGFAAVIGDQIHRYGACPSQDQIRELTNFVREHSLLQPLATRNLASRFLPAAAYAHIASGLLAITMSTEAPTILLWFRAEYLQTVNWAGNPHKQMPTAPSIPLTPRASFQAWAEQVRQRSRPWTIAETESAARIARLLHEARTNSLIREHNHELTTSAQENDTLLRQKDFLLKEVNHRVQNSLSTVAALLRIQSRETSEEAKNELLKAERRLMAVSLAHRRLYQDESVQIIDLSRYLSELVHDLFDTMGEQWSDNLRLELSPVMAPTNRAVALGLVLNELVTNLSKYAYEGRSGPVQIVLTQNRDTIQLLISDNGRGLNETVVGTGFGHKMLQVLLSTLGGNLRYEDNHPGTRAIVELPLNNDMN